MPKRKQHTKHSRNTIHCVQKSTIHSQQSKLIKQLDACIESLEMRYVGENNYSPAISKSYLLPLTSYPLQKKRNKLFDALIDDCYDLIVNTRNSQTKKLANAVLKCIYNDTFQSDDVILYMKKYLATDLANELFQPLQNWTEQTYKLGMSEVPHAGLKFGYNVSDKRAVQLLNNHNIFFIGEYYDHNNGHLIRNEIGRLFADAVSKNEIADKLEMLIEYDNRYGANYFKGFVAHAASRIRNVGNVIGYEKASIEYVQVFATLDDRTTEICREMNGRIIPVKSMSDIKDKFLSIPIEGRNVTDVKDDVKALLPFWKDTDTQSIKGHSTNDILNDHPGLSLPPYHWGCRTETIAYLEEYEETYNKNDFDIGDNVSNETKKYIQSLCGKDLKDMRELTNKIKALDGMKHHYYDAKDLNTDDKHKAQFAKILSKETISDKEYLDIGKDLIENSLCKGIRVFKGNFQLTYFADGGYTVIDANGNIKGIYPHKDINKCLQFNNSYYLFDRKGKK